jgi:hypothetical protein
MVVPSSLFHRRALFDRVGGWRHWRDVSLPSDFEWQNRARLAGARFAAVERLSVVKLTSSLRKDSYLTRRSDEQAAWWARICNEPDLPERELIEVLRGSLGGFDARIRAPLAIAHAPPGWIIEQLRWIRGLEPDIVPMAPLPPGIGAGDLPAAISGCPSELAAGEAILVEVAIDNRTDQLVSSRLPHPVHLSYHWLDSTGAVVLAEGLRSVIEPPLAPGESRTYSCRVRAPAREGSLLLRPALVQEGVRWFDDRAEGDVAVVVGPPTAPG